MIAAILFFVVIAEFGKPHSIAAENEGEVSGISITYPPPHSVYVVGMSVLVQTSISPNESGVERVRFFAETNLFAEVTNAPYAAWLKIQSNIDLRVSTLTLTAVAISRSGRDLSSAPVKIGFLRSPPPFYVYGISSPKDGAVILPSAEFTFAAELITGPIDNNPLPIRFLLNSEVVKEFDAPPYSLVLSNLTVGTYALTVRKGGMEEPLQQVVHVRVADLCVTSTRLEPGGNIVFEVLTAYPGKPTVLETSEDLAQWNPQNTNSPTATTYSVNERVSDRSRRFYRVRAYP